MIDSKTFYHQNIEYKFYWAADHHSSIQITPNLNFKLTNYYKKILSGDIPHELFNDPQIIRCSHFRLKGLQRGSIKKITESLISDDKIQAVLRGKDKLSADPLKKIPQMVMDVFKNYEESGIPHIPPHDTILHNLLIRNESSLSMETPIWNPISLEDSKQKTLPINIKSTPGLKKNGIKFTGHIDLVLYSPVDSELIIADYKPEGEYLRSLPQVAFYGLYIKKLFQIKRLKCMSFNKDDAWVYNPDILQNELPKFIAQYGNTHLEWQELIEKM